MKNTLKVLTLLIIFILEIILVSSCSSKIINENRYIEGQDYQFFYYSDTNVGPMAESEEGYYFFCGNYLFFADKASMHPILVCNKPNCLHYEETDPTKTLYCNAFFERPKSLFYYNKSLYIFVSRITTAHESEFLKVSPDGTRRKSLFKIDGSISAAALHRGVVYYSNQVWDANGQTIVSVNSTTLKGKSKEIYKEKFIHGNIDDIICYGNYVFFDSFDITESGIYNKMLKYNIQTGETEAISDNQKMVSFDMPSFINSKMYYRITKLNPDLSLDHQEAFMADIDGSNVNKTFDLGFPVEVRSDGQYLYSRDIEWSPFSKPADEQELIIYTFEGEVVDRVHTGSFGEIQSLIPGGKDHLFLQQADGDFLRIYYAEKSKISTGNMEWKLLIETEREKMYPLVVRTS
ncbi:hypothetical protein DFR55_11835 [Herbinix hemicellulosilytica]|uniref:Putative membrane protein n=1 Tax=Herbinix hemicellulosilytica TaxID=1564487 RepID=A0A0H5SDA1_HERHM|nr:hypothetical protein [Herbinix hemicellulosilytica]RBP57830.1 hypothetical protein DFR55_11835 [Herbinix hemicellulosilytica]CRZ33337.1 putative membrane protein [Herbinix hemicellulosilytica]